MAEELKVLVGAELKGDDFNSIKQQLENIDTDPIKLKIDDGHIQKQLQSIKKQIESLDKIKINIGGNSKSVNNNIKHTVSEVSKAYSDLKKLSTDISSTRLKIAGLDSDKNSNQIAELSGQLNRLMTDYNNLYTTFNRDFSTDQIDELNRSFERTSKKVSEVNAKLSDNASAKATKTSIEEINKAYKDLFSISKQIGNLELKIAGLDSDKNSNQIAELDRQLTNLKQTYQQLFSSVQGDLTPDQLSKLGTMVYETKDKLDELKLKILDTKSAMADGIRLKFNDGSFDNDLVDIESKLSKLSTTSNSLNSDISELRGHLQNMSSALSSGDIDSVVTSYTQYENVLKRINNQLSQQSKQQQIAVDAQKLNNAKETFSLQMDSWLKRNSKAASEFGAQIDNIKARLKDCDATELNNLESEFNQLTLKAGNKGKTGLTFVDSFKKDVSSLKSYLSVSMVMDEVIYGLKDMYKNTVEIDSAMTELRKVTNETDDTYDKFLSGTNQKAQKIGTTITGLVSSTADFSRLGYEFEDSQKLAEVANIYAVVGDEVEGVEGATESIISTMKAFGIETDKAITIVDKYNEIGNTQAISSGGIGEAMKRSASSMAAANNTIDETLALITAANTVVQDPASVGTAFKTKFLLDCLYVQKCA